MDTFQFIDIYATKGVEYLIIIGFLVSLVAFQKYFVHGRAVEGKGVFASLRESLRARSYLGQMRWNPVMSYMKNPDPLDPKDEPNPKQSAEQSPDGPVEPAKKGRK